VEQSWDYFSRHSGKNPSNARLRLRQAQAAAKAGDYEAALEEYIWFHENSADEPSMGRVRVFSYWADLSRVYPPAGTALEEIRDRKAQSLRNGFRDLEFFRDVVSINKSLGCERATYELFVELSASFPILVSAYAHMAMPAILSVGDFELARQHMPPPVDEIKRLHGTFQMMRDQGGVDLSTCVRVYARGVNLLVAALRGVGDEEQVAGVQAAALDAFDSPQIREAVQIELQKLG